MPQSGKPEVTLKGLVAYRERMALPADAVVDVWIADILFASKDAVPLTNPLKPADIELLLVRQGSN